MRFPPRGFWLWLALPICGVLLGAAIGTWWNEKDEAPRENPARQPEPATPPWAISDRWLSPDEIDAAVNAATDRSLAEIFSAAAPGDWQGGVNGPEVLRAALRRLLATGDPEKVAAQALEAAQRWKLTDTRRKNYLHAIATVLAEHPDLTENTIARLATSLDRDSKHTVLQGILEIRPGASPASASATARAFLLASGLPDDAELTVLAQSASLLAWMDRDADAAVRFAATSDRMAIRHSLFPGLRRALALNPERAQQILKLAIESSVYPEACGWSALNAGFSAEQLRAALAILPPEKWSRYLEMFAGCTHQVSPGDLAKVARAFPAREVFASWGHGDESIPYGTIAIAAGLAASDPDAVRAWLAELPAETRLRVLREAWSFPALPNVRFAELCLQEPDFFKGSVFAESALFSMLASDNLEKGLAALTLLPEARRPRIEEEMRLRHITENFRGNLGAAMDAVQSSPEAMRDGLRRSVFEWFGQQDAEQAQRWLEQSPEFRAQLAGQILPYSPFAPDRNREELLLQHWNATNAIAHEAFKLTRHYAGANPDRAIAWLARVPDGEIKERIAEEIGRAWASRDPQGATGWLQGLPAGRVRDLAASGLARSLRHDPDQAIHWTESIADPALRFTAVSGLIAAWEVADPAQALQLLKRATLADAQLDELRARLQRKPAAAPADR